MKQLLRWGLLITGAVVLGFIFVLIILSIKDQTITPAILFLLFIFLWVGVWIGSGIIIKKQNKLKQPFAYGFMIGMVASGIFLLAMNTLFPNKQELLEKAQNAEQEYFLLSAGSLDHSRICNAAKNAYTYYNKAKIEDKTKLFEYIVISDKCL